MGCHFGDFVGVKGRRRSEVSGNQPDISGGWRGGGWEKPVSRGRVQLVKGGREISKKGTFGLGCIVSGNLGSFADLVRERKSGQEGKRICRKEN